MLKASIIIRVYNNEGTIARALSSALGQDFQSARYEIIVVNDGSNDGTREILRRHEDAWRFRILDQKNKGASVAANRGFREARGDYVVLLDADDEFEPNFLKETSVVLDADQNVGFVHCDYYEKRPDDSVIKVSTENVFNTGASGILFRKSLLENFGYYREGLKFPEYDLLLRMGAARKGFHLARPLFWYYRRNDSLSGSERWLAEAMEELKNLHPDKLNEISKIRRY